MTREADEWIKPQKLERKKDRGALTVAIPKSMIQDTIDLSNIKDDALAWPPLRFRRRPVKSQKWLGVMIIEVATVDELIKRGYLEDKQ